MFSLSWSFNLLNSSEYCMNMSMFLFSEIFTGINNSEIFKMSDEQEGYHLDKYDDYDRCMYEALNLYNSLIENTIDANEMLQVDNTINSNLMVYNGDWLTAEVCRNRKYKNCLQHLDHYRYTSTIPLHDQSEQSYKLKSSPQYFFHPKVKVSKHNVNQWNFRDFSVFDMFKKYHFIGSHKMKLIYESIIEYFNLTSLCNNKLNPNKFLNMQLHHNDKTTDADSQAEYISNLCHHNFDHSIIMSNTGSCRNWLTASEQEENFDTSRQEHTIIIHTGYGDLKQNALHQVTHGRDLGERLVETIQSISNGSISCPSLKHIIIVSMEPRLKLLHQYFNLSTSKFKRSITKQRKQNQGDNTAYEPGLQSLLSFDALNRYFISQFSKYSNNPSSIQLSIIDSYRILLPAYFMSNFSDDDSLTYSLLMAMSYTNQYHLEHLPDHPVQSNVTYSLLNYLESFNQMSKDPVHVLGFGDSLTYGIIKSGENAPSPHPYSISLSNLFGSDRNISIYQSGQPGELTNYMVRRLKNLVMKKYWNNKDLKLAIILGGTNDVGCGVNAPGIIQNLIQLHQIIHNISYNQVGLDYSTSSRRSIENINSQRYAVFTLAITIPDLEWPFNKNDHVRKSVNQALREYAQYCSHRVLLLDLEGMFNYQVNATNLQYWSGDGVHFSSVGYDTIAMMLYDTILKYDISSQLDYFKVDC